MELWVRSQDREFLIKIENVSIDNENHILGNLVSDDNKAICDYWRLGTYKSKERALEVLDEIQELLKPIYKVTNDFKKSELTGNCNWVENQEYIPIQTKVYEMPIE